MGGYGVDGYRAAMTNRVSRVAAVVLAGGSGTRLGADRNKVFLDLAGRPMLAWSMATLAQTPAITTLVVAVRAGDEGAFDELLDADRRQGDEPAVPVYTVIGGATRSASEMAALNLLAPAIDEGAIDVVLIHDGARPFVDQGLIERTIAAARSDGGAIPGLTPERPIFEIGDRTNRASPLPSDHLRRVQTPQAFAAQPLLAAYRKAEVEGFEGVDTAEVVARFSGIEAVVVDGDPDNIKVTTADDLHRAHQIAATRDASRRSP